MSRRSLLRRLGVMLVVAAVPWPEGAPAQVASDSTPPPRIPAQVLSAKRPYAIMYDHAEGTVALVGPDGRPVGETRNVWRGPGGAAPLLELPVDRPIDIVVRNANTLLYRYEVEVESVKEKRVRMCSDVGRDFTRGGAGALVAALRGIPVELPTSVSVFDGSGLRELFRELDDEPGRGVESLVSRTTVTRTLDRVEGVLGAYLTHSEDLQTLSKTLPDSLRQIAEVSDYQPIGPLANGLLQRLGESDLDDPARVPGVVRARWRAVGSQVSDLRSIANAIREGRSEVSTTESLGQEVLGYDSRVRASNDSLPGAVTRVQEALLELRNAVQSSEQVYAVAPSSDYRRVLIRVRPTSRYQDVFRSRQGYVEVYTESVVGLTCQVSVGFAVVPSPPDFVVGSNGTLTDRARDDVRTAPLVGLSVSLSRLPLLGGFFGVGVGVNRRPDLYLGATLRLFEPVLLNGGWVWQHESTLPDQLGLGNPVADPRVLDDLDRQYVGRLFFGVSMRVAG